MAAPAYDDILRQIQRLSPGDQLRLLEALSSTVRRAEVPPLQVAAGETQGVEEVPTGYDPATDPIAPFIGAFHSGVPDLAERHDEYLAQSYADTHNDEQ